MSVSTQRKIKEFLREWLFLVISGAAFIYSMVSVARFM